MTHEDAQALSYLFVVTYGRSGSTTLQAVLNSIPGYLIRGENRQALRHLREYHQVLIKDRDGFREMQRRRGKMEPLSPSDPFYGIDDYPEGAAFKGFRQLVTSTLLRPEENTRVTGFKEIRWYHADVVEFIDWLRNVFPGARFIINTRRIEDVAASGWWAKDPEATIKLARMDERFSGLLEHLGRAAYHVHYDDYAKRPEALESMFAWLGEPFDPGRVSDVMSRRHSY